MNGNTAKLPDFVQTWNNQSMPGASKPATGDITQEIAATLRAEQARKNITKVALAKAVGISDSQMGKYLAGKKQFDVELLDAMCWALGLNLREVIVEADKKTTLRHSSSGWSVDRL